MCIYIYIHVCVLHYSNSKRLPAHPSAIAMYKICFTYKRTYKINLPNPKLPQELLNRVLGMGVGLGGKRASFRFGDVGPGGGGGGRSNRGGRSRGASAGRSGWGGGGSGGATDACMHAFTERGPTQTHIRTYTHARAHAHAHAHTHTRTHTRTRTRAHICTRTCLMIAVCGHAGV